MHDRRLRDVVVRGLRGAIAVLPVLRATTRAARPRWCERRGLGDLQHALPGMGPAHGTSSTPPRFSRLICDRGARPASLVMPRTRPTNGTLRAALRPGAGTLRVRTREGERRKQ